MHHGDAERACVQVYIGLAQRDHLAAAEPQVHGGREESTPVRVQRREEEPDLAGPEVLRETLRDLEPGTAKAGFAPFQAPRRVRKAKTRCTAARRWFRDSGPSAPTFALRTDSSRSPTWDRGAAQLGLQVLLHEPPDGLRPEPPAVLRPPEVRPLGEGQLRRVRWQE